MKGMKSNYEGCVCRKIKLNRFFVHANTCTKSDKNKKIYINPSF